MSDIAIRVENLGKAYRITSQRQQGGRYKTLQEELLGVPGRLWNMARGYGDGRETVWALKDVSLEVREGEVVGIIGRNGAGKSTLLKILCGITEPTEGQATVYGRVGSLLEVGTGFHPELTGRENVFLNGAILGMRRQEVQRKFDQIVAFAGVEQYIDTPVKRYSSGMQVRLAFSVAAHLEPEILLVDEVLAVGDAEFQKKCLGKMGEVAGEGRTVVFVSHNMNAVERICTDALLLDTGRLKHPPTRDVRSLIKAYLFGQDAQSQKSMWTNRGNEHQNPWFKPLRFRIADEFGNSVGMPVSNDIETWIEMEGEVNTIDPALTVGYAIYAEDGGLLYWSYQTDSAEDKWPKLTKGICVLKSRMQKRLLNEGVYRIELIGSLHFREWLFRPGVDAPSIHLTVQGGLSDSPLWTAKRPGQIAPVIEWSIDA